MTGRWRTTARVGLGVVGAYLFAWSVAGAGAALLLRLGVVRSEAVLIAAMAAFLVYLVAALWAFVAHRLWPVTLCLVGGWLLYLGSINILAGS